MLCLAATKATNKNVRFLRQRYKMMTSNNILIQIYDKGSCKCDEEHSYL